MTTRAEQRSDAALVEGYLAGDGDALAALYDRYGPGLYDTATAMLRDRHGAADVVQDVFCVAATKLGQLRDPSRVKPWLYAVARHEIYRRTKRRGRERTSIDALIDERGEEPMAAPDPAAEASGVISAELAAVVRDAAAGLDENDQLVLELSARQGLVGADLAAAMGVSPSQAHTLVHRMRERLERAVGAVIVTRGDRAHCAGLAAVLEGWDGRLDVLWRKRISRHIDRCETCQATRRGAAVLSLAGAAPAFAAPWSLRQRTLDAASASPGMPAGTSGGGRGGGGGGRSGTDAVVAATTAGSGGPPDYRFDRHGFPVADSAQGTVAKPVAITAATVIAIAAVLLALAISTGGVHGSIGPALAPGAPPPADSAPDSSAPGSSTPPELVEPVEPTTTATTTRSTTAAAGTSGRRTAPPPPPPPAPPPAGDPPREEPPRRDPDRSPEEPAEPEPPPPTRVTLVPPTTRTPGVIVIVTTTTQPTFRIPPTTTTGPPPVG